MLPNLCLKAPIQEDFGNDSQNSDEDYNIPPKPVIVEKFITPQKNEEKESQDIEATISVDEVWLFQ